MKILIIGASSYLGARLYFDLSKDFKTIGTFTTNQLSKDFIQLDITQQKEVEKIISQSKPDVVIQVAANANPRWCEARPQEAVELNQYSTQHIVNATNNNNAKLIYISSYAVIKPWSVYGKTKLESESIIKKNSEQYVILRPYTIFGMSPNTTNDRPFNRLLKNLNHETEAIYDTSWKFQPTYIHNVSEIIKVVIERKINIETIPVAVKDFKSRYDIAKDILKPFNIKVKSVNNHDLTPLRDMDISPLEKLHLPIYTYGKIIEEIIKEVKDKDKFILH